MMTPTPISDSVFKRRHAVGSRSRADKRGRVRALIVRPEEMLDLIRDTYANAPIPPDAQFFGISIDDHDNKIGLHFYSVANPTVNCVNFKPDFLLNILKGQSEGVIPNDAELLGVCVHDSFTLVRMDVTSGKFPSLDVSLPKGNVPCINIRYNCGDILISDPSKINENYKKYPALNLVHS